MDEYQKLTKIVENIRKITSFVPDILITLGSGLGELSKKVEVECEIKYSSLEGFPVSTVKGHDGKFIFGKLAGKNVVVMSGRVHFYEGYSMEEVVTPVRVCKMLGAKIVFLTNAAGGVNEKYVPGDLMMITDHISSFVRSPLIGKNIEELGTRFPDMSNVYDKDLQDIIRKASKNTNVDLKEGIYLQETGPNYETPAEIKMIRNLGADAVGMSTVVEAIVAAHMGVKVCGISCITNMAAGILDKPLNHKEVQETADKVKDKFLRLVMECIKNF